MVINVVVVAERVRVVVQDVVGLVLGDVLDVVPRGVVVLVQVVVLTHKK